MLRLCDCVCVYAFLTSWLCVAKQQVNVGTEEGIWGGGWARGGSACRHWQRFTAQSLKVHFTGQLCIENIRTQHSVGKNINNHKLESFLFDCLSPLIMQNKFNWKGSIRNCGLLVYTMLLHLHAHSVQEHLYNNCVLSEVDAQYIHIYIYLLCGRCYNCNCDLLLLYLSNQFLPEELLNNRSWV